MPMVSVIVPTRNAQRTIEACLISVRNQIHKDIQLIVVDNASDDATPKIAQQYADIVINCGPERSAQRNRGAALAAGSFLLFIDADMSLDPGLVAECLRLEEETEAPGLIITEVSTGEGFWAACRALERSCYSGDDLIEAPRFISAATFKTVGGFDEELTGPEDWDLGRRLAQGRSLPRTRATITHDEGRIRLRDWLAKKRYYGASFRSYWRKHGFSSVRHSNTVFRPAYIRNWRRLVRRPLLTSGMLALKAMELGAGAYGAVSPVKPIRS